VFDMAKIPEVMCYRLMAQAMEYITDMKNLQPIELNGIVKSRIEHFMGAKPNWATNLREFGEAGMVKTRTKLNKSHQRRLSFLYNSVYTVLRKQIVTHAIPSSPNTDNQSLFLQVTKEVLLHFNVASSLTNTQVVGQIIAPLLSM
jgi:hypothetical protein